MTTTLSAPGNTVPVRPTARRTGPSLPALVALEARKSLTTRSGKALAAAAVLLGPGGLTIGLAMADEPLVDAAGPLAVMGMLTAFIVMAIGVLSTAGEWAHKSVQTTYLLVPSRGRVLTAKATAVALLGAAFTAVAVALAAGAVAVMEDGIAWDGAGQAFLAVIGAGAAFAVTGAGVGAALANSPASLTGLYLVILGVMPVLHNTKPEIAEKVDPSNAVLNLAQGQETTTSVAILAGWAVVSLTAGAILTHRRAVQ
jgi:ABC-2 type transport system permease protein